MFGKVFASMYDGTLATRGPWQALVTFQQFIVLADRTGIVDMTAEAISRRTTIPLDIINIGIAALEQEDSASRSPDLNGQRIARLSDQRSWGWQVVNYEKYRKIRSEDDRREYMAQLMRDRRAAIKKVNGVSLAKLSKLAHADADADVLNPLAQNATAFARFWTSYPRRKSKGNALKAWAKVKPAEIDALMAGLNRAKSSPDWQRDNGRFIPYPATWLNARGWEDEAQTAQPRKFVI